MDSAQNVGKALLSQESVSTSRDISRPKHVVLVEGLTTLVLAATLLAGVQGQLMSTTLDAPDNQLISTLYMSSLGVDILSGAISLLAIHQLHRHKDDCMPEVQPVHGKPPVTHTLASTTRHIAFCLFAGLGLLLLGSTGTIIGFTLYVYHHQPPVLVMFGSLGFIAVLPYFVGFIGREPYRRVHDAIQLYW